MMLVLLVLLLLAGGICWWAFSMHSFNPPTHADEVHTITTPDLWHLRLCRHKAKAGTGEPVLMVHGFMSTQFNFSVPAGASMADALAEAGYDCWLIDLRGNSCTIPPFGRSLNDADVDDYILKDIPTAIQYIQKVTGFTKVHWVGHSMGGMLLYSHDAVLGSADLASGTTLGSPIGFQDVPFQRPALAFLFRRSSRLAFRCGERLLVSICHVLKPQLSFIPINYENMNPILDAATMFSTMDAPPLGVAESMAKAAETHVWRVKEDSIDVFDHLKDLQTPLFAIFGAGDPFVPPEHAKAFFDGIVNTDKQFLLLSKANGHVADYSHVDLVFGTEAKKEVYEPIIAWLRAHAIGEHPVAADNAAEPAAAEETPKPKRRPAPRKVATVAVEPVAAKTATAKKAPAKKTAAPAKAASKTVKPVEPAVTEETPAAKPAKKAAAKKAPAKKPAAKKAVTAKSAPAASPAAESKPPKNPAVRKYASTKDKF